MTKLDQEEQEILDAFESGKLKQSKNAKQIQKRHQPDAEASLSMCHFDCSEERAKWRNLAVVKVLLRPNK